MEEGSVNESVPDLKDLEQKIGRKTPEGLLKWMREDASHRGDGILKPQEGKDLDLGRKGLAEKIRDLKMEMMDMRGDRRCRWSREMEREPSFLPSVKAEGQTERWCLFLEDSAQPVYTISLHCGLDGAVLWKRSSLNIGGKVSLSSRSTADRPVLLVKHPETAVQHGKLHGEEAHLRSVDVKILQQLVAVHEGIEAVKWLLEERSTLTSRCSSLTSSQYSLGEGPDTSLRGSWSSLQDPNDKLDNISIGSYLDTLADDMDEYCPSSSESVLCSTPLGKEVSDRTGGAVGSPLARSEHPKAEQPIWAKLTGEVTKAQEAGRAASTNKDGGQTQLIKSNGFPEKVCRQGAATESARACLSEKLGKTQSPKLKPYKNGKIDLEGCKLNSKMHLEYDAHWRWVQSQDDVTFL